MRAQYLSFGDSTQISLITCAPGKEVYERFGHSGVRLFDPVSKLDVVFNYGIFSFQTDNFILKFIKGETDYYLGVVPTNMFLPEYQSRNSNVWEQVLNLTPREKQKLIESLLENFKPENRKYRYNFVFDNCATRPRDKILSAVSGYVRYDKTDVKTFRQWIDAYLGNSWTKFGIDLLLGKDADTDATRFESFFLPEELMHAFESAKITEKGTKNEKPLIVERRLLVSAEKEATVRPGLFDNPVFVFYLLMILGIGLSVLEVIKRKYFVVVDSMLLVVTGLAGLIVFYLSFFSVHPLVKMNLNILWLNPVNIVAGILILFRKMQRPLFFYQLLNIILIGLAMLVLALSIQSFNSAVFPILVLLLVRYSNWVFRTKRMLYKRPF